MWQTLTKSRSADYHRESLMKLLAFVAIVFILWQPLAPVRYVASDVLFFTADQLKK
jgi:hypothetical protein